MITTAIILGATIILFAVYLGYRYLYHTAFFDRFESILAFLITIGFIIMMILYSVFVRLSNAGI